MTSVENERLGVVETKVGRIEVDVAEIKADVKTLVLNQIARDATEAAEKKVRAQTGVWVRFLSERAVAVVALGVSIFVFLKG